MKLTAVNPQPRFGAWNSDPARLTRGAGWEQPPVRFINHYQERKHLNATHEVGHFLALLSVNALESVPYVYCDETDSATEVTEPKPTLHEVLNHGIVARAGDLMEGLLKKTPSTWRRNAWTRFLGFVNNDYSYYCKYLETAKQCIEAESNALKRHHAQQMLDTYRQNLDTLTQAHLQQYDRPVVEELARHLMRDKNWNFHRVEELTYQYHLLNVPSLTRDTIPPANQVNLHTAKNGKPR